MDAVIFDIDGTLIDSSTPDSDLYMEAVHKVLGNVFIRPDWAQYAHVTDIGILLDIHEENGIEIRQATLDAVKEAFVALLGSYIEEHGPLREIPGAVRYVQKLLQSKPGRVGYATGAWRDSARTKLLSAGFQVEGMPLASADDFRDRVSIMRLAFTRLKGPIHDVTYYGDGPWDQAAANYLGWQFVPVGSRLNGLLAYEEIAT